MEQTRALIIVDSLDIPSLDFRQTLDVSGFATDLVIQNQATLEQVAQVEPDVIFLHLNLPDIAETDFIERIRSDATLKNVPVIALTAYQNVAHQVALLSDVVLLRPVDHQRLENLLSILCSIDKPIDETPWDALTGFYTPSFFLSRLNQAIDRSRQMARYHYIVFSINLDQLMKYEKKFGKEYRQQILQGAANVLKKVLRPNDIVSRFDSDQFLVLIENAIDRYAPITIADRMQFEFNEYLVSQGLKNRIRIEIGVIYCTSNYQFTDEVLYDAQLALQMARQDSYSKYKVIERTTLPGQLTGIYSLTGV